MTRFNLKLVTQRQAQALHVLPLSFNPSPIQQTKEVSLQQWPASILLKPLQNLDPLLTKSLK